MKEILIQQVDEWLASHSLLTDDLRLIAIYVICVRYLKEMPEFAFSSLGIWLGKPEMLLDDMRLNLEQQIEPSAIDFVEELLKEKRANKIECN